MIPMFVFLVFIIYLFRNKSVCFISAFPPFAKCKSQRVKEWSWCERPFIWYGLVGLRSCIKAFSNCVYILNMRFITLLNTLYS